MEDISFSGGGRISLKIQILVRDGMRIHRLVQDDPGDAAPAVRTIRVGDSIVAMMQPDVLGPNLERVWSLTRGSEQLVSYRETLQILLSKAERARLVAFAIGTMGLLLLSYAFALRIRRGAWYHVSESR